MGIITGVYKITSPSGNFYIGSSKNIKDRFRRHKHQLRTNTHKNFILQKAWNKYGDFLYEIIEECVFEFLIEKEQYYINTLKPEYNISKSALNPMFDKDIKIKHKKAMKVVASKRGKSWRDNVISSAKKRKEIPLSNEHKTMISEGLKNSDKRGEDFKKNISEKLLKVKESKCILCVELNKIFTSVKQAAKFVNGSHSNIRNAIKKQGYTAYGFHWEYVV